MSKKSFYGIPLDDVGGDSATALIAIFLGFPVFFFIAVFVAISLSIPIALIVGIVMAFKYFSTKHKSKNRRHPIQYKNISYPSKPQNVNSDSDLNNHTLQRLTKHGK